ncbi:hypothetical protein B0H13DRAFT_1857434 [Mycena leptocephala]|nr:hypothetical protein B0H13DRAFT_1857434 [Mycena leptocephala]
MRLEMGPDESNFAKWLLGVGEGNLNDADGALELPEDILTKDSDALINSVFPGIHGPTPPHLQIISLSVRSLPPGTVLNVSSELGVMPGDTLRDCYKPFTILDIIVP